MEWLLIILRTAFVYLLILFTMRLMGKREIGKLSAFDLIVYFMIADLSAIVLESASEPLLKGVIPILTLVVLQIITSYIILKSKPARNLVEGEPTVIIKNGKIQDASMARSRYNMDDLLTQLREKNIPDVADVEFAILETSGKLSVVPKEEKQPITRDLLIREHLKPFRMPVAVIIDGKVQEEALTQFNLDRFSLKREIQERGYKDFKEVFYASINHEGKLYIDRKDND